MTRVYGDIGDLYGSHANAIYGTLFDTQGYADAHVQLLARVTRAGLVAEIANTSVRGKVTSGPIIARVN